MDKFIIIFLLLICKNLKSEIFRIINFSNNPIKFYLSTDKIDTTYIVDSMIYINLHSMPNEIEDAEIYVGIKNYKNKFNLSYYNFKDTVSIILLGDSLFDIQFYPFSNINNSLINVKKASFFKMKSYSKLNKYFNFNELDSAALNELFLIAKLQNKSIYSLCLIDNLLNYGFEISKIKSLFKDYRGIKSLNLYKDLNLTLSGKYVSLDEFVLFDSYNIKTSFDFNNNVYYYLDFDCIYCHKLIKKHWSDNNVYYVIDFVDLYKFKGKYNDENFLKRLLYSKNKRLNYYINRTPKKLKLYNNKFILPYD
jgi:hypothetical protein